MERLISALQELVDSLDQETQRAERELSAFRSSQVEYFKRVYQEDADWSDVPERPNVLLRLEDSNGFGPYTHRTGPPQWSKDLDLRWGVARVADLDTVFGAFGPIALERDYNVAAYLVGECRNEFGPEFVFSHSRALKLGHVDIVQFDQSAPSLMLSGIPGEDVLVVEGWTLLNASVAPGTESYTDAAGSVWNIAWPDDPLTALSYTLSAALNLKGRPKESDVRLAIGFGRIGIASTTLIVDLESSQIQEESRRLSRISDADFLALVTALGHAEIHIATLLIRKRYVEGELGLSA